MRRITQFEWIIKAQKALEAQYPQHDFRWQGRRGICPEHPDQKPSLYLYLDHGYCYGCGHYFSYSGRGAPSPGGRLRRDLLEAIAAYLQEQLAANEPQAARARRWLGQMCGLEEEWLLRGAQAGERTIRLPIGLADPLKLGGVARQKARDLGIDLEKEKKTNALLTGICNAAYLAAKQNPIKGEGVVAFIYETSPGRISTFKFRPIGGGSGDSRFPTGRVEGVFGLRLLEPRLFSKQGILFVEGETDALAIQASALHEQAILPVVAVGGKGRFVGASILLHKLEPSVDLVIWPDADVSLEKIGADRKWKLFGKFVWPYGKGDVPNKVDPRDLVLGKSFKEVRELVQGAAVTRAQVEAQIRRVELGKTLDKLEVIAAPDLLEREFPAPNWVIPNILPEGLAMLAGPPKIGKSWLCLGLGLAVAVGGRALGKIEVERAGALYLALEDSPKRLQGRLEQLVQSQGENPKAVTPPAQLYLTTEVWPRLEEGGKGEGLELLEIYLEQHPNVRLVMIDTLARLRPRSVSGRSSMGLYDMDYSALEGLQALAGRRGVCILVVHHLRKMAATDPLDLVSGSTGLTAGVDTILVLRRSRGMSDGELFITGRDVEEQELALKWDAPTASWVLLGDAEEYRQSRERREILKVLRNADEPLSPKEIAEALGKERVNLYMLLSRMRRDGQVRRIGQGRYSPPTT